MPDTWALNISKRIIPGGMSKGGWKMSYTVNSGYVVLDENSDLVEWFDEEDDAWAYVEELEEREKQKRGEER